MGHQSSGRRDPHLHRLSRQSHRRSEIRRKQAGRAQARPDPRGRQRDPQIRRHDRRGREPLRNRTARHHRADRTERRRQNHVLQPDDRLRYAEHRHLAVRRQGHGPRAARKSGAHGHGPHLPADQGDEPSDRARQYAPRRPRAAGRRHVPRAVPRHVEEAGAGEHRKSRGAAGTLPADQKRRTITPARFPAANASCWKWHER